MSRHTPPPAPANASVDKLARQLRFLKIVVLLLAVALAAGAAYFAYQRHLGQPVTILVDGKPVATLRDEADANRLLEEAETAAIGPAYAGQTPIRLQTIRLQRSPNAATLNTDADARARLMRVLKLRVHAWLITVNNKPALGLPTEDAADQTLEMVKQHFAQMPPVANLVGDPSFVQDVSVVYKTISLTRARPDPQTSAPYFWTPPPSKKYTIQQGDTGYKVAVQNHIAFTDFLAANPGRDLDHLRPGDTVNVQKMPLLLSVRVRKTFSSDLPVLPHGPPSEAGLQRVTYVVTYVDGQETSRDVSNAVILKKPATQSAL